MGEDKISEDARRLENLIRSRQTIWSDIPAELISDFTKVKHRINRWNKEEHAKNPIPKTWVNPDGFSCELFSDLIGELRAAESRKRLLTLKLDINKLRETRCKYLISLQANAVDAIRLKKLLQASPGEHEKSIPRLFTKSEKQRVEEILHYDFEMLFGRQNW